MCTETQQCTNMQKSSHNGTGDGFVPQANVGMPLRQSAENTAITRTSLECPVCGSEFESLIQGGNPKVYCSGRCRDVAYGRRYHQSKKVDNRTCEVCARPFSTTSNRKTWCSPECNVVRNQRLVSERRKRVANSSPSVCVVCGGPSKRAASSGRAIRYCSTACRRKSRNLGPFPKQCVRCGKEFLATHSVHKFCSTECQSASSEEKRLAGRRSVARCVECSTCGGTIANPRPSQKYCSEVCRLHSSAVPLVPIVVTCKTCNRDFTATRGGYRYCSTECRRAKAIEKAKQHYKPQSKTIEITCKVCEVTFVDRPNKKYCSQKCRRASAKKSRKKSRQKMSHVDRCKQYGGQYEPINPLRVFERDKYLCGICLAPVNKDVAVPHPLAATLDHKIPLSRGGGHVWDNVRCAHFACNSRKTDCLDEEIRWPEAVHPSQQRS